MKIATACAIADCRGRGLIDAEPIDLDAFHWASVSFRSLVLVFTLIVKHWSEEVRSRVKLRAPYGTLRLGYGRQTACGGDCLRQATSGVRTGRAAPMISLRVPCDASPSFVTQALPAASTATACGVAKLAPLVLL